jgi:hypothetical protein
LVLILWKKKKRSWQTVNFPPNKTNLWVKISYNQSKVKFMCPFLVTLWESNFTFPDIPFIPIFTFSSYTSIYIYLFIFTKIQSFLCVTSLIFYCQVFEFVAYLPIGLLQIQLFISHVPSIIRYLKFMHIDFFFNFY